MKSKDTTKLTPRKKKDIVCKAAFAEWFIDFLRFLYPDADAVFDLDRGAEAMEKELLEIMPDRERNGGTLLADLLMKVYLRDGTEQWLLVHVELENQSKEEIASRIWGYYIRLVDKYPVPIIPIVVFTGGPRQKRPSAYNFAMLGVSVDFRFKAYHVFDHTMDELLANPNPMALVILACQAEAQERRLGPWRLNEIKKRIVEGLVERGITDTGEIMRFIRFLNNLIYLNDMELNVNFVSKVEEITKGAITMGINETLDALQREEGMRIGEKRGERKGKEIEVENLITKLGLSNEQAADVAEVSVEFVAKIRAKLAKKSD